MPVMEPDQRPASQPIGSPDRAEAAKAVRFLAIKAAIFMGIPLSAALVAALAIIFR